VAARPGWPKKASTAILRRHLAALVYRRTIRDLGRRRAAALMGA
jgi:hypothetical protein